MKNLKSLIPAVSSLLCILFLPSKVFAQQPQPDANITILTNGVDFLYTGDSVHVYCALLNSTTNGMLDWGDGTPMVSTPEIWGGNMSHVYTTPGTKHITLHHDNGYFTPDVEANRIYITSAGLHPCRVSFTGNPVVIPAGDLMRPSYVIHTDGFYPNLLQYGYFMGMTDTLISWAGNINFPSTINMAQGLHPVIIEVHTVDTTCMDTGYINVYRPVYTTFSSTLSADSVGILEPVTLDYAIHDPWGPGQIRWGDGSWPQINLYPTYDGDSVGTFTHKYYYPGNFVIEMYNHFLYGHDTLEVAGPPTYPLTLVHPQDGDTLMPYMWDTLIVNTVFNDAIQGTFLDSAGTTYDMLYVETPFYSNNTIQKYLVRWPMYVRPNSRLAILMYDDTLGYGTDTIDVSVSGNVVIGNVYYDANMNGQFNPPEQPFINATFNILPQPPNYTQYFDVNGQYTLYGLSNGTNTISLANAPLAANVVPALHTFQLPEDMITWGNDFAVQPNGSTFDLGAYVYRSHLASVFPGVVHLNIVNYGPNVSDPTTFTYHFNPANEVIAATGITPLSQGADSITFDLPSLQAGEAFNVTIDNTLPVATGTAITESVSIAPLLNEYNPQNNSYALQYNTVGSLDPNDITATPDTIFSPNNVNPPDIGFVINFQNTGTLPALNIHVVDTIAPEFDLTTLNIRHASHTFEYTIKPNNVIDFTFNNIMLMDSTSDEAGSHGHIAFTLRPKPNQPVGGVITSAADIYFDYNPSVRTNNAKVYFLNPTSIAENVAPGFSLYPNPAQSVAFIKIANPLQGKSALRIYAADGRLVYNEILGPGKLIHMVPINQLPAGIYNVQLVNGTAITSQKLVVY